MEEIHGLSKQIDFNNLTYRYKGNTALKTFIGFKGLLGLYKNINKGYITLEKAEEEQQQQKESKLEINEIVIRSKKSEDQKSAINNVKTLYESEKQVIKMFDDYSRIVSEAK